MEKPRPQSEQIWARSEQILSEEPSAGQPRAGQAASKGG